MGESVVWCFQFGRKVLTPEQELLDQEPPSSSGNIPEMVPTSKRSCDDETHDSLRLLVEFLALSLHLSRLLFLD